MSEHAAAIREMMDRLHRDGLMPGTETVDAVIGHADELARHLAEAEARAVRQARHIEHLESMVREAYDDEGIIWRARRQYSGWPDEESGKQP